VVHLDQRFAWESCSDRRMPLFEQSGHVRSDDCLADDEIFGISLFRLKLKGQEVRVGERLIETRIYM
jgi:hypothetical protein